MNNNMQPTIKTTTKIPFFRRTVLQNFPFIEKDFDALTDYELLCKVVEYLNKVIEQTNLMEDNENELVRVYNELYNYVENYFDNLDVQEEINNKLDEMASNGTLQEIIADYLNSKAVFGFDTVDSMKQATNLINGSYAQTLGFYEKNDGGNALYKIRNITNNDVVDNMFIIALNNENLIAELIVNENNTINVKQLGAKGDGITDDTTSIQTAINKDSVIYFSEGTYLISSPLSVLSAVKEIRLSQNAKITTNSEIESIILIDNSSTNLIISGGTIDCNSKAKRGIFASVLIYTPTFKNIMITNATECGLQIRDDEHIGGSCHGYLEGVKIYNQNTLATCIKLCSHDMQITDCELFYTNCGIDIKAHMQTISGVHIWAGGEDNTNSNTYGIKYDVTVGDTLLLNNIYFDGMNTCVYANKGMINMNNIIFYNPSEGTYNNPVGILFGNTYAPYLNLNNYYMDSVVAMSLLEYENYDVNNLTTKNIRISEYYNLSSDKIFKHNKLDFGCNYFSTIKKSTEITRAFIDEIKNNKYYLFGYYVLKNNSKKIGEINLRITNPDQTIDHKLLLTFSYDNNYNVSIKKEKLESVHSNNYNVDYSIILGESIEVPSLRGNNVHVLPLYLCYDGNVSSFYIPNSTIATNLNEESPGCLMLFNSVECDSINIIKQYRCATSLNLMLAQNISRNIFLTNECIYKIYCYDFASEEIQNTFREYTVAKYKSDNVVITKTFTNSSVQDPTIAYDTTKKLLNITSPSGYWYYIKTEQIQ